MEALLLSSRALIAALIVLYCPVVASGLTTSAPEGGVVRVAAKTPEVAQVKMEMLRTKMDRMMPITEGKCFVVFRGVRACLYAPLGYIAVLLRVDQVATDVANDRLNQRINSYGPPRSSTVEEQMGLLIESKRKRWFMPSNKLRIRRVVSWVGSKCVTF